MHKAKLQKLLRFCLVVNLGVLAMSFLLFQAYQEGFYQAWGVFYGFSEAEFRDIALGLFATWKMFVLAFIAIPYFTLSFVGQSNTVKKNSVDDLL